MQCRNLRDWIAEIDRAGELKRVNAEVDWDLELSSISRRVIKQEGPALLFENIKDHQRTACRKLFINGLGTQERVAMALGLPRDTSNQAMIEFIKGGLDKRIDPVKVASGSVKENIIKGDAINLYEFPVPKWAPLDGGRFINTYAATVTMDPDTKIMNVGMYRGMIGDDKRSIPVLLVRSQHWGTHLSKYEQRGEEMPVAVVFGYDPLLLLLAASPISHPGYSEYDLVGGLRGGPVDLVKCETSDLYVPASAEIVIEGRVSPDTKTFQMEGPYGEYPGFYAGVAQPKPTIRVDCITHRDDPIFRGGIVGITPDGNRSESYYWVMLMYSAVIRRALENSGIPGILGVWGSRTTSFTNLRIQIDKTYRGQAKQVAAALWGLGGSTILGKNLVVVDRDIDIFNDEAVEWAIAYRTNATMGAFQFFPGAPCHTLDPSLPISERDELKYGAGKWTRVLIDATVNWDLEPQEQYGGRREPPLCTVIPPEIDELLDRRWLEYGL